MIKSVFTKIYMSNVELFWQLLPVVSILIHKITQLS